MHAHSSFEQQKVWRLRFFSHSVSVCNVYVPTVSVCSAFCHHSYYFVICTIWQWLLCRVVKLSTRKFIERQNEKFLGFCFCVCGVCFFLFGYNNFWWGRGVFANVYFYCTFEQHGCNVQANNAHCTLCITLLSLAYSRFSMRFHQSSNRNIDSLCA